jgi:hypothetical protein
LPILTRNNSELIHSPFYSPWPWFGEICWGFKEGLRTRSWRVLVSWFAISRAPCSLLG